MQKSKCINKEDGNIWRNPQKKENLIYTAIMALIKARKTILSAVLEHINSFNYTF